MLNWSAKMMSEELRPDPWATLSPEAQEAGNELWDLLYHHYTLAEFYDDLCMHPWYSGYNSSKKIDTIIEYNGVEYENLYVTYKTWIDSGAPYDDKPIRPDDV